MSKNLQDKNLKVADYHIFDSKTSQERMVINSNAISSLHLLEVDESKKNSLFDYLDRCRTAMGRRLLKRWLCSPLTKIEAINARLDAVEDLVNNPEAV